MAASSEYCIICVLNFFVFTINCFNIDTENVLIFQGQNQNSYFGFSSALTKNGNNTWLLVGAPRDNSSAQPYIPRPGNLYRCTVNFTGNKTTLCTDVYNAIRRENPGGVYQQENQLFGSNIYVNDEENYVACASQVKRTHLASTAGFIFIVGHCNIGDVTDLNMAPQSTVVRERPMFDPQHWHWGTAMLGFSYTPLYGYPVYNGVMGGPGIFDGKGGFVLTQTSDTTKYKAFSIQYNSNLDDAFKHGSYLGYALATGRFGTDRDRRLPLLVASAPHFSNDEGHVGIVLLILPQSGTSFSDRKSFTGDQPGAGFGGSLAVLDINGDSFDDLLVGSPFHTDKNTDEGLVDIFYGTGNSELLRPTLLQLRGLRKRNARFGTTISGLGDINNDQYNDVAIGAPYEDDQRGAVYIYNGNEGNLNTQHSQRIAASELDSGLKAFGFHVSKAFDIDSNTYNDISVGAYMSDRTVILRSRPIVRLTSSMVLSPPMILLNSSGLECQTTADDIAPCVTIVLCFNFTGRGVDQGMNIDFTLEADTGRTETGKTSRILLQKGDGSFSDQMTERFHLKKQEINCNRIKARVPSISREFFQAIGNPVVFKANYSLSHEPVPGHVFPILDKDTIRLVQQQGNISNGCSGGICRSDLKMETQFSVSRIILGDTREVIASVQLLNLGNPAYGATVKLSSSSNAVYTDTILADSGSVLIVCNSTFPGLVGGTEVVCDFERPFFKQQNAAFVSKFNVSREHMLSSVSGLDELERYATFNITTQVRMPSIEIDNLNNQISKMIPVKLSSDIEITSSSEPDQVKVSDNANGVISFTHTYEVYNKGPSPLPPTLFNINVPIQGRNFVNKSIRVEPSDKCRFVEFDQPELLLAGTKPGDQIYSALHSRKKREAPEELKESRRTIKNITCSDTKCAHIECAMGLLEKEGFFTVSIHQTLSESLLEFEKDVLGIRYSTNVTVYPSQHPLFIRWQTDQSSSVKIDIYPATVITTAEKIEIWIIIVGCVGGILLFVLLGIILWKCGFFKRTKREQVQDWKRKSGYNQRRSQRVTTHRQSENRVKSRIASTTTPDWVEDRNSKGFD